MTLRINKTVFLIGVVTWEYVFLVLSAAGLNEFQLLNIIGFLSLAVLPGMLTLIVFRIRSQYRWMYIPFAVGLSVFELMTIAFMGNEMLPYLGVAEPLGYTALLWEYIVLVNVLLATTWVVWPEYPVVVRTSAFDSLRDAFYALLPAFFTVLSILGAIELNNGRSGILTLVALIGIGVYSIYVVPRLKSFGPNVVPTALFFISLALLLMTSLRGWFITGHDIQREYSVFQLTKLANVWDINSYRDAYNACLSITILPTYFSKLLSISDPYIYKVYYQIIFAFVPSVIYAFFRRYVAESIAFIAVLYLVAFPTFFGDMPFLIRQEIAFLFFVLMLYLMSEKTMSDTKRQVLFMLLGVGMIFSHYSTTYTVVALLLFLACARPFAYLTAKVMQHFSLFARSSAAAVRGIIAPSFIKVWMILTLAAASFIWSAILTDTASGSLYRVFSETIAIVQNNANDDSRSNDLGLSLFASHYVEPEVIYSKFQENAVATLRAEDLDAFYPQSILEKYPAPLAKPDLMPLTWLGNLLTSFGFSVQIFNEQFRQATAKMLQISILIGLCTIFFSSRFVRRYFDTEFLLLSFGSLLFVAVQVILPVLSVEYGVFRAFQQSLFFLAVFAVIGVLVLLVRLGDTKRIYIAGVLSVLFFCSSTGVFTQALGGYGAQLHLNNAGSYYNDYYLHESEVLAISWLKNIGASSSQIQSSVTLIHQFDPNSGLYNSLFPGVIRKDSYVLLGIPAAVRGRANLVYDGTGLTYDYPVQFLEDNKDLIYVNSGGPKIFR